MDELEEVRKHFFIKDYYDLDDYECGKIPEDDPESEEEEEEE